MKYRKYISIMAERRNGNLKSAKILFSPVTFAKITCMKKWLLLAGLALIGVAAWYFGVTRKKPKDEVPKEPPVAVSRYSAGFNGAVGNFLNEYHALSEAFVTWDSAAVTADAGRLAKALDNLQWDEVKKDTVIYETAKTYTGELKTSLGVIGGAENLTDKRHAFHTLSQNLYDLLRTVKYDGAKLYLQQCPMAFNDTEEGLWLSKDKEIRNPYLGLHHPKYKSGMLACGETKDTLSFQAAQ